MFHAYALKLTSALLVVQVALDETRAAAPPALTLPQRLSDDIAEVRVSSAAVAEQLRKFNELYVGKLESRMVSTASSLSALHANTDRLLDRAHVWDTLQLHVSAWTEQMHTLSSKMDLLGRAQENLSVLEARLASLPTLDYRLETLSARLEDVDRRVEGLSRGLLELRGQGDRDRDRAASSLEGQFMARGALAALRGLERKVEGLGLHLHSKCGGAGGGGGRGGKAGGGLVVRCHSAPAVMDLLKDISAKVDALFDQSASTGAGAGGEVDADVDNQVPHQSSRLRRLGPPTSAEPEDQDPLSTPQTTAASWTMPPWSPVGCSERVTSVMKSLTDMVMRQLQAPACSTAATPDATAAAEAAAPSGCEALLAQGLPSGVYTFRGHARYCDMTTSGGGWTVIQRRGDWGEPRLNFSRTWAEYKEGFGDPSKEFWVGNEWLHRLTQAQGDGESQSPVRLRVQLWDWEGELAVAEYASFAVLSEADLFRLSVGNYSGNATDALAAHSGRPFSTWDSNHDEAPSCCPCAPAYAAGWWFDSCFEANLNGEYHTHPEENEYYRGIIWEGWRGDYSLRSAVMMIRNSSEVPA